MELHTYTLDSLPFFKIHGRNSLEKSPYTLFWSAAMLELNIKATELWVELDSDYEVFEQWITIIIDDVPIARQMLLKGHQQVCVFRCFDATTVKNVKIVKDVQAMAGMTNNTITVCALRSDALLSDFLPIADKTYKIEVIGDSITSGEGIVGATCEMEWVSSWISAVNTYEWLVANDLNADIRVLSQCGWGVYCSFEGNPEGALPHCYESICSLDTGSRSIEKGSIDPYDFSAWQPDAVIVNLGTNDAAAKSGEPVATAVTSFLHTIRRHNPHAMILWVYGMFDNSMEQSLINGITAYKQETSDSRVEYLHLEPFTPETVGARNHPGKLAHRNAADAITDALRKLL